MVKEAAFWKHLCEDLNYRFFTGIPFEEVTKLYQNMNKEIMHYIPAVREDVALKLATGAWISGFRSAIILEPKKIYALDMSFNVRLEIPTLFITSAVQDKTLLKGVRGFHTSRDLDTLVKKVEKGKRPGILVVD